MEYEQDEYGNRSTKLNNQYHSYDDKPALIESCGDKYWFKEGLLHRDNDLPAFIGIDGRRWWYKDGVRNRDNDLPAIVYPNGYAEWFIDGTYIKDCNNYKPTVKSARSF